MVFNLFVIEGYKHVEIANMIGISVGTSKSNLAVAREKLKKMLIIENDKLGKEKNG
jgi:RNA polymerase sigma-70 factor (ECF subfamily)